MTSVAKPERANRKGGWSGGSSFPPEEPRPSAALLRGAIQSVLSQTYSDFELAVLDDSSTDNTESVVDSFGDRVSYGKQGNKGLPGAKSSTGLPRGRK